jgi:hypothetical protein
MKNNYYEKSLSFIAFVCALISTCGLATAIGIITEFCQDGYCL